MRVSLYEMIFHFEEEGTSLLFNGLCGSLDVISYKLGRKLDELVDVEFDEDLFSAPLVESLCKRRHLTQHTREEEIEECRQRALCYEKQSAFAYSVGKFSLLPTYSCNFCCSYCFEHDMQNEQSKTNGMLLLSSKQIDSIFNIISEFPYLEEKAQIELFGGEPLYSSTVEVVEDIINHAIAARRSVSATTNGYELNLFRNCLGPGKIELLCITVDGPKQINDKRRVTRNGEESFDRIIDNIKLAMSLGTKVRARVNLDRTNLTYYEELIHYFLTNGFFNNDLFTLTYGLVGTLPGKTNVNVIDDECFFDYVENNIDRALWSYAISEQEGGIINNFSSNSLACTKTRYCGAVGTALYFSPDGMVYNCSETVGCPEYAIGTFDEALHINNDSLNKWQSRRMPNIEGCITCPLVFTCSGGCAFRAMYSGKPNEPFCGNILTAFDRRIRLEMKMSGLIESGGLN